MTERELLRLKKDIEDAKEQASQLQGKLSVLQTRLKDEWDCDTLEQAQSKANEMEDEIDRITEKIESGVFKLNKQMQNI